MNDGEYYLFLERNGALWRAYGGKYYSHDMVEIEYFAKRGIKVKDIAAMKSRSYYSSRHECYAVYHEGNPYRDVTYAPSAVALDDAEYQRIFCSNN